MTRRAAVTMAGLLLGLMVWAPIALGGGNGIGSGGLNGFPPPAITNNTFGFDGGAITASSVTTTYAQVGNIDAGFVMVDTLGLRGGGAIFHSGGFEQHNLDAKWNTGLGVFTDYVIANATKQLVLYGEVATSGSATGVVINNDNALGSGDKILSIQNNEVEKAYFAYNGDFVSSGTMAATGYIASTLADSATAVTVTAATGCTSPTVTWSNGTAAFQLDVGTSCTGISTIGVTFPAAANAWACKCNNVTADATRVVDTTGAGTATTVTLTNYSRTTGTAADFADGADVRCICRGG